MLPKPIPGQVIRYSYLWQSEYLRGHEEGVKDRPCAVILVVTDEQGEDIVTVLPVTHTPPSLSNVAFAVEIPHATKRRLGLDDARSWIRLDEANQFVWPGPDLRPAQQGDLSSVVYGELPAELFIRVRDTFLAAANKVKSAIVPRSE